MSLLVSDVADVIRVTGRRQATVLGHDWGGMVAWSLALAHPDVSGSGVRGRPSFAAQIAT